MTIPHILLITTTLLTTLHTTHGVQTITIAGVLSSKEMGVFFHETIDKINELPNMKPYLQFNATTIVMDPNPIKSAMSVCDVLLAQETSAVIVSHPPPTPDPPPYTDTPPVSAPIKDLTTNPISYTCGYYGLPVVGISARHIALSDKHLHSTFARTVPPYFHQAKPWIAILTNFTWDRIVFIHSRDEEGYAIYSTFVPLAAKTTIKVEKVVTFAPGLSNYTALLWPITQVQAKIILLYANKYDADNIFEAAHELGLTGRGFGWLVTEQALEAEAVPVGTLGLRLMHGTNERAHITDSLSLLSQAFLKVLQVHNISTPPEHCNVTDIKWDDGPVIYRALLSECLESGETGHVCFNDVGDRLNPVYDVINVHMHADPSLVVTGIYGTRRPREKHIGIKLLESKLVFPGNTTQPPTSVKIVPHLRILTIAEPPFLKVEEARNSRCHGHGIREDNDSVVLCSHTNHTTGKVSQYCCMGYSMDLIATIARYANFTFNMSVSFNGYVGSYVKINGTNKKKWDGLIGKLVNKEFDLIATPMTIIQQHTSVVSFSRPFKFQGLTILAKKTAKESSLGSFLQPFDKTLWVLIMIAVHAVALSLYLLDRFSPFGRYKLMKSDDCEDDALNFSSAIWFTWSVLMNSGVGEGTPRSFSARVLGMVWAGFGMILIASYTANLAAFLVLDNRPEATISDIDDSRLRNPQENFTFATINNSAVNMFFQKKTEYTNMFKQMQKYNYDNVSHAINDVKSGKLQAFIWDHARLEYEAALDCNLMTSGDKFGSWQYGFGIFKDLYWIKPINDAIVRLQEEDGLDRLNSKWLIERRPPRPNCSTMGTVPATLGLTNMAGVFMMVGVGIILGLGLLLVEIGYKRHNRLRDKELELARNAADRWRSNVIKRRALRKALNGEDVHRNSMCESLLRGVASRSTFSSIPNPDSQPNLTDNTAMLQAQAVAVFDHIL